MQFFSLSSADLSPEIEARLELGETADIKMKSLEELKILIGSQFDSSKSTIDDIGAFALISGEIDLQLESAQIHGAHAIFDFKDCTFQQLYHLSSIRFVKRYSRYLQECWPCRVKGLHVINEPSSVHYLCFIMCTFLSKKMKQRFHIHGDDVKSLHRYINPEVLPEELGGTAEPINPSKYQAFILSQEAYIQKLNQYGFSDN
ncbi:clavesin-2-like isoform X2 [Stegodyphus dumicola]|uniref:clavesin-2-like isoform X2 n=1 Tax=Stegodyphus dumicola TaxID=202533 RepID=UPI0015B2087C|nr:clavesin-2-like isoform X2 [Stegodyphus dumicola]